MLPFKFLLDSKSVFGSCIFMWNLEASLCKKVDLRHCRTLVSMGLNLMEIVVDGFSQVRRQGIVVCVPLTLENVLSIDT